MRIDRYFINTTNECHHNQERKMGFLCKTIFPLPPTFLCYFVFRASQVDTAKGQASVIAPTPTSGLWTTRECEILTSPLISYRFHHRDWLAKCVNNVTDWMPCQRVDVVSHMLVLIFVTNDICYYYLFIYDVPINHLLLFIHLLYQSFMRLPQ